MAFFQLENIEVKGIAAATPQNKVANKNFAYHSELENKQFIKTTGIEYRRIVENGITASDLCLESAKQLLDNLAWDKNEINILVFISQTPDYKIPCTATILQNKLELSKSCLAFDVNLGCSGYVYGLSIIGSLLEKIQGKALLLVGDASSTCINQKDKTTAPLFSDAGSATALQFNIKAPKIAFNLQSDGSGFDAIITKDGGSRNPVKESSFVFDEKTGRTDLDMFLDGIKVFNFSRREVVPNVNNLLQNFEITKTEIDYFVFHQANKFMNDAITKKLDIEISKVPQSLQMFGNTGAASIPFTIVSELKNNILNQNKKLLLSGFGVGLSWGSCVLNLDKTLVLPLIEM